MLEIIETAEHPCWACGSVMTRPASAPGRHPRWCSAECRTQARTARRRLRAAEARETARRAHEARRKATLIRRYGPEGAAELLRVKPGE